MFAAAWQGKAAQLSPHTGITAKKRLLFSLIPCSLGDILLHCLLQLTQIKTSYHTIHDFISEYKSSQHQYLATGGSTGT